MPECSATISGNHQWSYRKKQVAGPNGTRYHPTIRDSWITFVGCVCGLEAPPNLIDEIRQKWRETKQAREWHGEAGEQTQLEL